MAEGRKDKKDLGVAKAISELAKEKVKEAFEEKIGEAENKGNVDEHERSINDIVRLLASQVPESNVLYGKFYKRHPLPEGFEKQGILFLTALSNITEIDDVEVTLANLVNKKGWGSGIYQLRLYQQGVPGIKAKLDLAIQADEPEYTFSGEEYATPPQPLSSKETEDEVLGKFSKMTELAKSLKELGSSDKAVNPPMNVDTIMKAVADAFKSGLEVASGKGGEKGNSLLETITALKSLGLLRVPEERPTEDPLDLIVKLKTAGLIKTNDPGEDSLSMISKMKEIMELMGPLMGKEPAEPQSALMKLIDVLGPKVPEMVGNVTKAVSAMSEVSKMKLAQRLSPSSPVLPSPAPGGAVALSAPPPPSPIKTPDEMDIDEIMRAGEISVSQEGTVPVEPVPVPETSAIQEESTMNPIIKKMMSSIKSFDKAYFPELRELIIAFAPGSIDGILAGQIKIPSFLSQAAIMLGQSELTSENSNAYFTEFISWIKSSDPRIFAKCKNCGEEYVFDDMSAFNEDSKECDKCQSLIEILESSQTAEPAITEAGKAGE